MFPKNYSAQVVQTIKEPFSKMKLYLKAVFTDLPFQYSSRGEPQTGVEKSQSTSILLVLVCVADIKI